MYVRLYFKSKGEKAEMDKGEIKIRPIENKQKSDAHKYYYISIYITFE